MKLLPTSPLHCLRACGLAGLRACGLAGLRACGLAGAKLGLIICLAAVNVHAQNCQPFQNYLDNGDGTVTDTRNGLMWKHCSEGAKYQDGKCKDPVAMNWFDAMQIAKNSNFADKTGWRLPTQIELEQVIVWPSYGDRAFCVDGAGISKKLYQMRWTSELHHVWTTTSHGEGVWIVELAKSHFSGYPRNKNSFVKLVRAVDASSNTNVSEFEREYADKVASVIAKVLADKNLAVSRQREYEAKQVKDAADFNSLMRASQPRAMYLGAVSYEDSGEKGKAKSVYRELMKRYSASQEALLASQRLTRLSDVEAVEVSNSRAANASFDAAESVRKQNYQQCQNDRSTCYSRCSDIRDSSARSSCQNGCKLCSQ